jgi:hypothetical protein
MNSSAVGIIISKALHHPASARIVAALEKMHTASQEN